MNLKVGIVGATGIVGRSFIELLEQRNFPVQELRPFASEKSLGKTIHLQKKEYPIKVLQEGCFKDLDLVFFSSGDEISRQWAPQAVAAGAFAIDNSAAFRMSEHPLIVPEVNGHLIAQKDQPCLIANPNCSTIQLVVALKPLQKKYGLQRVIVSTYQAISGAGTEALNEFHTQTQNSEDFNSPSSHFPAPMAFNCVPQVGSMQDNGFCSEEIKIINESRKILEQNDLEISALTVRVPVINGHSESVWVTFKEDPQNLEEVYNLLGESPGIDLHRQGLPTAKTTSKSLPVHVGRIHKDLHIPKTWIFWVVADNIYKGAALNGLQIAEHIFDIHRD